MAGKQKKPTHEVHLKIKDKVWKGKGKDTLSALQNIEQPKDVKSFATVETVIDGKLSYYPIKINMTNIKRLFANEWEQELLAKRIDTLR